MTYAEFAALASAVQSLFVAVAILIGGIWAVFRFRALNERARSQAELAQLRNALEREPAIALKVETQVLPAVLTLPSSIQVIVQLQNLGKAPDVVDWSASGVASARVVSFSDEGPDYDKWTFTKLATDLPWKGADIRPAEHAAFSLLVCAPQAGVYCLEVIIALSPRSVAASSAAIEAAGMRLQNQLEMSSVVFVAVTEGH